MLLLLGITLHYYDNKHVIFLLKIHVVVAMEINTRCYDNT